MHRCISLMMLAIPAWALTVCLPPAGVAQSPPTPGPAAAASSPHETEPGGNPPPNSPAIQLGTPIPVPPAEGSGSPAGSPAPSAVAEPQPPFALNAQEQEHMGRILDYWQAQSARIQTFSCKFSKYTYDTVFGPENEPKFISEGVIRYATPDKGEFHVIRFAEFVPGKKPNYPWKKSDDLEHWICDGSSVFQLDSKTKQLIELRLPPELRGRDIADGPVPFIFGASRTKIESRYWIREVIPRVNPAPDRRVEFCLEAYPKRRSDAGSFQRVMLILDGRSFLPKAMQIFPPSYDERNNRSRDVYQFADHKVNTLDQRARQFIDQFISPELPTGWKHVVDNFESSASELAPQSAQRTPDAQRTGTR